MDKEDYDKLLKLAETQYRFAVGINTLYTIRERYPKLPYPDFWTWGKHSITKKEMQLTRKEAKDGAMLFSHTALYILVVQIDTVLERVFGKNRFTHNDGDIQSAASIARLIRNAFAHNPFYPIWIINKQMRNKMFRINRINVELNTSNLENKVVKRSHYGGPLAILELSRFVRSLLKRTPG